MPINDKSCLDGRTDPSYRKASLFDISWQSPLYLFIKICFISVHLFMPIGVQQKPTNKDCICVCVCVLVCGCMS